MEREVCFCTIFLSAFATSRLKLALAYKLNYLQNVEECDATMFNRSDTVRYLKLYFVLTVLYSQLTIYPSLSHRFVSVYQPIG